MKYVRCDHCNTTFNPLKDGGLSVTLGTMHGTQVLDFCPKHAEQLLRSLDKYTHRNITEEDDVIDEEEVKD